MKLSLKTVSAICLLGIMSTNANADWWESTKEMASSAWDSTTATVKSWTSDEPEEKTLVDEIKEGASSVAETMTDKKTYSDAWDSSKQTVKELASDAQQSDIYQEIKNGAGEVVDNMTDKQTYVKAWDSTKETASEITEQVTKKLGADE